MLNIAVLVSGGGTNLQAIIDSIKSGFLNNVSISIVIASKDKIYALERAEKENVKHVVIDRKNYESIEEYDNSLIECLKDYNVDLIVLAGFMIILGDDFISKFKNKIINIHPSLIPSFCGNGYYGIIPHKKALDYGVKVTGATVHFVEKDTDVGPIILQESVKVLDEDTPEILQKRVMEEVEWKLIPQAIKYFEEGRVELDGRKVIIRKDGGVK
jgi:phosphoribosylglycinamide formyltransferase-1